MVVRNVVPAAQLRAVIDAIHGFLGTDAEDPESWYRWEYDIYADHVAEPDGRRARPPHGPCGMVQMYHHASLWAIRQSPRVHAAFADIYGTERLWVTSDRAHFKPPQRADKPAWSDAGPVHHGLHWDTDTRPAAWPVPYGVQGVVCLTDTPAERGALRVVPGFHRQLAHWTAGGGRMDPESWSVPESALPPAVSVPAAAGDLVIWHSSLPHGPGSNISDLPRYSQVSAARTIALRCIDGVLPLVIALVIRYSDQVPPLSDYNNNEAQ